jgi:hypothetical protein
MVRNPDPERYRVHWKLGHGSTACEDGAEIEPRSEPVPQCTPKIGWELVVDQGAGKRVQTG